MVIAFVKAGESGFGWIESRAGSWFSLVLFEYSGEDLPINQKIVYRADGCYPDMIQHQTLNCYDV